MFEQHAVVTFNNVARQNAMSLSMWQQLTDTMQDLAVEHTAARELIDRCYASDELQIGESGVCRKA